MRQIRMGEGRRAASIAIAALLFSAPGLVALGRERVPEGRIALETLVQKEIRVRKENGESELKRIPADRLVPGDEVIYTIQATNISDGPVGDVIVIDPVVAHARYREGSATGEGTQITFSVDGGETYELAEDLEIVEVDGTVRSARPSDYTHIRWEFTDAFEPGESRYVQFRGTSVVPRATVDYSAGGKPARRRSKLVPGETAIVFRHELQ